MAHDLDTPEGRLAAAVALGPAGYNAALRAHHEANVIETVNGYRLVRTVSARFGALVMVEGTDTAFRMADTEKARAYASGLPARGGV